MKDELCLMTCPLKEQRTGQVENLEHQMQANQASIGGGL
jgi:hypothetical protein